FQSLRRLVQFATVGTASAWRRRRPYLLVGMATVATSGAALALSIKRENWPELPLPAVVKSAPVCSAASIGRPQHWMTDPVSETGWLCDPSNSAEPRVGMERLCMDLQGRLCRAMEELDGEARFIVDKWARPSGGGGISCVLTDGVVFERAGVNISVVHGSLTQQAVRQMNSRPDRHKLPEGKELPFCAIGISSVIHPRNPFVPTMHFNFRYFEIDDGKGGVSWWYGGGADLTPTFLDKDDATHFHRTLKAACDNHDKSLYPKYKAWCDNYFVIEHRGERRGVGGIFFDDVDSPNQPAAFAFVSSCADAIEAAYLPIVRRNMRRGYSYADRQWQLLRRGRYVEFNLVYDRGTKFGLFTKDARIESILMSLPPLARWEYCHDPDSDPVKAQLMRVLREPVDWA
uniref:coproporphyrinogen oxidase n=2 Tax=Macrostomum lignano TaxID=282301 RepID=A0A1I8H5L4_9PLAT